MFKIRNIQTGEYYPRRGYYKNLNSARRAFRRIMNDKKISRSLLEMIEYEIQKKE